MAKEWERQQGESSRAFRAFMHYRDLGPDRRSLNAAYAVARETQEELRAPGTWYEWSAGFRWVERAAAWDAYLDGERLRARARRARQLEERRAEFEFENQDRLERRVQKMEAVLDKADSAPITDVWRDEVREAQDGTVTKWKTRIKGMSYSGYARLVKETNATAKQAITGVRDAEAGGGEASGGGATPAASGGEFVWVKPDPEPESAP